MDDLHKLLDEFDTYSLKLFDLTYIRQPQAYSELKDRCNRIWHFINSIHGYLFDYRIILMNSILSDIFDRSVPPRKPRDPKIKTLKEVAFKEEIENELERRFIAETK